MCSAAEVIGKYIKYYVTTSQTITQQQPAKTQVNTFAVMMAASKANAELPPVNVRTGKDKMYNSLLLFIKYKSLKWNSSEISSGTEAKYLSTLRDALWYIDRTKGSNGSAYLNYI